jgi:hypothetical protein
LESKKVSQNLSEGPTGELFELQPGVYEKLLAESQKHVWAVPPVTEPYTTQCGLVINVPIQPRGED